MGATSLSRSTSPAPRKNPRWSGRPVSWRRDPALRAKYMQLHAQLIAEKRPMSGRAGGDVYYWADGHLCWRVHVVPQDPHTAAQERSRAAFGAASRAWSGDQSLTDEQRDAWHAEAAKLKSRPRLAQSGPLTAQQHYVGRNSLKERWGLPLLLEPAQAERMKDEGRRMKAESAAQGPHARSSAPPASNACRTAAAPARRLPLLARARAKEAVGTNCPSQVPFRQRLTRPSSGCHLTTTGPLPGQHRCQARSPGDIGRLGMACGSSTRTAIRRNARFRELWRGG